MLEFKLTEEQIKMAREFRDMLIEVSSIIDTHHELTTFIEEHAHEEEFMSCLEAITEEVEREMVDPQFTTILASMNNHQQARWEPELQ